VSGHTFLVLTTAFLVSLPATAMARLLAGVLGVLDRPSARKLHNEPIPLLGGAAIGVAFALALLLVPGTTVTNPYVVLIGGAAAMFALGLWDDLRNLSVGFKLSLQAVVIGVAVASGMYVPLFDVPMADRLISFAWILLIANGFNLLDNMDGLAAGTAGIAAAFLMIGLGSAGEASGAAGAAAVTGASAGFLLFNRPPARIFMGDAGSLFIGFVIAGLALFTAGAHDANGTAVVFPLLVLALPLLDTLIVVMSRLRRGTPIWTPGKDHLSHRLLRRGWSPIRVLCLMYAACVALGLAGLALMRLAPGG
jgi:UDP-GlcNAc:undecaprenyl-phosphate/decaprenyl-phosphate GlcNAc-1-phosphate transferase